MKPCLSPGSSSQLLVSMNENTKKSNNVFLIVALNTAIFIKLFLIKYII